MSQSRKRKAVSPIDYHDGSQSEEEDESPSPSRGGAAAQSKSKTNNKKPMDPARKALLEARQIRNRQSAQNSRDKKRAQQERLEGENASLKVQLQESHEKRNQLQSEVGLLDGRVKALEKLVKELLRVGVGNSQAQGLAAPSVENNSLPPIVNDQQSALPTSQSSNSSQSIPKVNPSSSSSNPISTSFNDAASAPPSLLPNSTIAAPVDPDSVFTPPQNSLSSTQLDGTRLPAAGTYYTRREFDDEKEVGRTGLESINGSSIYKRNGCSTEGVVEFNIDEGNGMATKSGGGNDSSNPIGFLGGESGSDQQQQYGSRYRHGFIVDANACGLADGKRSFGSQLVGLERGGFPSSSTSTTTTAAGVIFNNNNHFSTASQRADPSKKSSTQSETLQSEELLETNHQLATWLEDCLASSTGTRQQTQRENHGSISSQDSKEKKFQEEIEKGSSTGWKVEEDEIIKESSSSVGNEFETLTSNFTLPSQMNQGHQDGVDEETQLLLAHLYESNSSSESNPSPSSYNFEMDVDMSTDDEMALGNALGLDLNHQTFSTPTSFNANHFSSSSISQMEPNWSSIFT